MTSHRDPGSTIFVRPVNATPIEVLGDIFYYALWLPQTLDSRGRRQLLNFCLVCRTWRNAALAMCRLWSQVDINMREGALAMWKVASWLERSGGTPKTVEVSVPMHWDCASFASDCKQQCGALAKLLTEGPVLDCLSLCFWDTQCFRNLVELIRVFSVSSGPSKACSWNSIKSLALEFRYEWSEPIDESDSTFTQLPASITSLWLELPPPPEDLSEEETENEFERLTRLPIHIPPNTLHRLTSLQLVCGWRGPQLLLLLQHCHNLENLVADFQGEEFRYDPSNPLLQGQLLRAQIITFPTLQNLGLQNISSSSISIFEHLVTPKLVGLDLSFADGPSGSDLYDLCAILEDFLNARSRCQDSFRELEIQATQTKPSDLLRIFRSFSLLTHLTLSAIIISDGGIRSVLEALCLDGNQEDPDAPEYLQQLEVLQLLRVRHDFPLDVLQRFIAGRSVSCGGKGRELVYPNGTLRKVVLTYMAQSELKEQNPEDFERIRTLRGERDVSVSIGPWSYFVSLESLLALP